MMEIDTLTLAFEIDDQQFDAATFDVIDFNGEEHISQPFRFEINLVSHEAHLTLADVANKPATLAVVRDTEPITFHGLVIDFEQGPHVGDRFSYRAVLVPRLWMLSLSFQSRTFLRKNVPDIVEEVLRGAGFQGSQYRFDLTTTDYPAREYCVQYQETDLAFISRLLEHEGIHFFFDEGMVVFRDESKGRPPAVAGVGALVYNPGGGLLAAAEAVRRFTCREKVVPGTVVLRDYNYRTTDATQQPMEPDPRRDEAMPGLRYEYGEHFPDQAQGDRLTRVRHEEIAAQRRVMRGESGYVGLRAGHRFTLSGHFRDLDGEYRLLGVHHRGTQGASVPGLMQGDAQRAAPYRNEFVCLPARVIYRPPRTTPEPKIPGLMTGRIEAIAGDYAHLDDQGRYRLRTWYDRGAAPQAEASHWVRMKQAYSGPDYGIHFPNHAETEVVLAYVDGDPNRPVALGTAPHPQQASPVTSANNTQNVIRTYASNEMVMEDLEGATKISLTSAGRHNAVLDDGGRHIGLTTSGGHTLRMHDEAREIHCRTTDGHHLLMQDAEEYIHMQTKNQHVFRMDDAARKMGLRSTDGHKFTMNDADQYIVAETADGHSFVMDDRVRIIGIKTKVGHTLTLSDEEQQIWLGTKGRQRLGLSDLEKWVYLSSTKNNRLILSDEDDAAYLSSESGKVQIDAATEIKLIVGDNSITISQTGIAINGTDLTEITANLVTIN